MNKEKILVVSLTTLLLSACGGGGDSGTGGDSPKDETTPSIGVFLDSAVSGLAYKTTTYTGTTNTAGEYKYLPGETIIFSVGGITLGSAIAGPVTTPLSLVPTATDASDPVVTNIVRLLLTLDDDNDPANGIQITPEVVAAAKESISFESEDFTGDPAITRLLTALPNTPALVSARDAQTHFALTLSTQSEWGAMTWGNGTWKSAAQ